MNIAQAKQQVANAMQAYFTKDELGHFRVPPEQQRPVFLMGPPGIGKTAIVRQVAEELGVGLVSYSMTHHTRQSALGLPKIIRKTYPDGEYDVTEYTMSEIISSVHDVIAESGAREGILFLDEINCVSETLTPVMLQFLQFKTFGRHRVPDGWIVVTAGNPPEYNRSAREFDIVTWDRLKRIDIEPDFGAWREYALRKGIHPSVLSYLDIRKEYFYRVEQTVEGRRFVTARGWTDLSQMLELYEQNGLTPDILLISQYVQDPGIAEDFAVYYDLWCKYRSDYQADAILAGTQSAEISARAAEADFDERLSLLGLLLSSVTGRLRSVMLTEDRITRLLTCLRAVKAGAGLQEQLDAECALEQRNERRGILTPEKRNESELIQAFLRSHIRSGSGFADIKRDFDSQVADMRKAAAEAGSCLEHLFSFAEAVWPDGQELLILVTELTVSYYCARFIARYGCEAYTRHSEELMFYQRRTQLIRELEQLETEL